MPKETEPQIDLNTAESENVTPVDPEIKTLAGFRAELVRQEKNFMAVIEASHADIQAFVKKFTALMMEQLETTEHESSKVINALRAAYRTTAHHASLLMASAFTNRMVRAAKKEGEEDLNTGLIAAQEYFEKYVGPYKIGRHHTRMEISLYEEISGEIHDSQVGEAIIRTTAHELLITRPLMYRQNRIGAAVGLTLDALSSENADDEDVQTPGSFKLILCGLLHEKYGRFLSTSAKEMISASEVQQKLTERFRQNLKDINYPENFNSVLTAVPTIEIERALLEIMLSECGFKLSDLEEILDIDTNSILQHYDPQLAVMEATHDPTAGGIAWGDILKETEINKRAAKLLKSQIMVVAKGQHHFIPAYFLEHEGELKRFDTENIKEITSSTRLPDGRIQISYICKDKTEQTEIYSPVSMLSNWEAVAELREDFNFQRTEFEKCDPLVQQLIAFENMPPAFQRSTNNILRDNGIIAIINLLDELPIEFNEDPVNTKVPICFNFGINRILGTYSLRMSNQHEYADADDAAQFARLLTNALSNLTLTVRNLMPQAEAKKPGKFSTRYECPPKKRGGESIYTRYLYPAEGVGISDIPIEVIERFKQLKETTSSAMTFLAGLLRTAKKEKIIEKWEEAELSDELWANITGKYPKKSIGTEMVELIDALSKMPEVSVPVRTQMGIKQSRADKLKMGVKEIKNMLLRQTKPGKIKRSANPVSMILRKKRKELTAQTIYDAICFEAIEYAYCEKHLKQLLQEGLPDSGAPITGTAVESDLIRLGLQVGPKVKFPPVRDGLDGYQLGQQNRDTIRTMVTESMAVSRGISAKLMQLAKSGITSSQVICAALVTAGSLGDIFRRVAATKLAAGADIAVTSNVSAQFATHDYAEEFWTSGLGGQNTPVQIGVAKHKDPQTEEVDKYRTTMRVTMNNTHEIHAAALQYVESRLFMEKLVELFGEAGYSRKAAIELKKFAGSLRSRQHKYSSQVYRTTNHLLCDIYNGAANAHCAVMMEDIAKLVEIVSDEK